MAHRRFNIQSIICFAFGIGLIFPSDAQAQFEGIDPATSTIDHAIVLARDEETPPESQLGLEVIPN